MSNAVNTRILLLKSQLELTDIEFCAKASISTATFNKIKNKEEVSARTLQSIIQGLGLNKEWLYTGKGEPYANKVEAEASDNPWKNVAFQEKAKEVENLKSEVKNLWSMIDDFRNGRLSFLLPVSQITGT